MSALEQALTDYLQLRRSLGHELAEAGWLLPGFVAYLDAHGSPTVTIESALTWVQDSSGVCGFGGARWVETARWGPALPLQASLVRRLIYTGRSTAEAAAVIRARIPDLVTLNEIYQDDVSALQRALAEVVPGGAVPKPPSHPHQISFVEASRRRWAPR